MEVFQFYTVDEANRRVKTIAEQNFRAAKKEVKTIYFAGFEQIFGYHCFRASLGMLKEAVIIDSLSFN